MGLKFPEDKELLFGYASVVGTIVTVIYTVYSGFIVAGNVEISATIIALCLLNFFLVISAISLTRRYFRLETQVRPDKLRISQLEQSQVVISKVIYNINHQARNLILKINKDLIDSDFSERHTRNLSFQKYLVFLMDNIKEIFDVLTDDQCSVCIKIIVPGEYPELTTVKTHYRDSISFRERKLIDSSMQSFPYYENTAFKQIIQDPYKNPCFICNDLKKESGYLNMNKNWYKYYNASMVVPISLTLSKEEERMILGFICIDNMKGGFEEKIGRNIISAIADLNFLVYKGFEEYHSKLNQNDK